ncbi:hypothetical protein ETD96_43180 [Actinomadura geliboluensis]|uniref:Uncharacterized protein n=1 Tax=Actinomadura geliboluensis TaxID=882440 RepID=A0A5S4FU99_9ACTN|nr:hypothetical protein ETD96_43180 [Actinomadura geliboluensis]
MEAVGVAAVRVLGDVDAVWVGVFVAVVPAAGEGELVDVGGASAEGPAVDVVDLAQRPGDIAALDRAGGVQGLQDLALWGGGEPDPMAQVERGVAAAEQEG